MRQIFLAMLAATGLAVLGTTAQAQQVLVNPTTTVQYTPYYYGSTSYYTPYSSYSPGVTYYSTPYANSYYYPGYTSSYAPTYSYYPYTYNYGYYYSPSYYRPLRAWGW